MNQSPAAADLVRATNELKTREGAAGAAGRLIGLAVLTLLMGGLDPVAVRMYLIDSIRGVGDRDESIH